MEVSVACVRGKNRKAKVDFIISYCMYAPFCVMVPKLLVPMVKRLAREENRRVRQGPVPPEWKLNAIHPMLLGNLLVFLQAFRSFCHRIDFVDGAQYGCTGARRMSKII